MKKRGQAVADKIVDTAERLFYTQGYHNTGINQIIEESDIAKGSLYKHFENKTDLMAAYVERLYAAWYQSLESAVNKVTDPKQKIIAVIDYHKKIQKTKKNGGCPFIKASDEAGGEDPEILAEVQHAKARLKKLIGRLVAKSGHKQVLTDKELTETIFLMLEGGIAIGSVFKNDTELAAAKKIVLSLM